MPVEFLPETEAQAPTLDFQPEPQLPKPDDLRQAEILSNAATAYFESPQGRAIQEEAYAAAIRSDTRNVWDRFRDSGLGRRLFGPPSAEREVMFGSTGSPGEIAGAFMQFSTVPPQVAEPVRSVSEPLIGALPAGRGVARGVREFGLGFPLAPLPAAGAGAAGKALLAGFTADYLVHLPEQRAAFERALLADDIEGAQQIATQNLLGGGLLALATKHAADKAQTPVGKAARALLDEVKSPTTDAALRIAADRFAIEAADPRYAQIQLTKPPKLDFKAIPEREAPFPSRPVQLEGFTPPPEQPYAIQKPSPSALPGEAASRSIQQVAPEVRPAERAPEARPVEAPEVEPARQIPPTEAKLPTAGVAETITGSKERKGSEMPAETGALPVPQRPAARPAEGQRIPDIIDALEAHVGKIRSKRAARPGSEHFYGEGYEKARRGAGRRLFSSESTAVSPDVALETLHREGLYRNVRDVDQLWPAMESASGSRRQAGAGLSAGQKQELKQLTDFERTALRAPRSRDAQAVAVDELFAGDEFTLAGTKFKVTDMEVDPNTGDVMSVQLEDGPRFGTQRVGAETVIHLDAGSVQRKPPEFAPAETAEAERPFQLAKPESVEEQAARFEAEAGARERQRLRQEMEARAAAPIIGRGVETTGDIFGEAQNPLFAPPAPRPSGGGAQGDPLGSPVPRPQAAIPPGAPGTAMLFDARLPVTLPRSGPGSVGIPAVMQALEEAIVAAGGVTPIRTGRFHQRARGIYKPHEEVVRLKSADNIPTATHEIGHAAQKLLYGSSYARGLRGLAPAIKRELVALGKALYGSRKPNGGYTSEGWAEFMRYYLTTDEAAAVAPLTERFFRERVLADHPEFAAAIDNVRKLIDVYRTQGSVERARQQLVKAPGTLRRIVQTLRDTVSMRAQVEEFEPLWQISQGYKQRTGQALEPAADPFLLASWKRGSAGAVVETMVNDAMIDPWGNPVGPPLRDALAPVKGHGKEFALYLLGRRAVERWRKGKNPGITKEDAQFLVERFQSPEMQLAADKYYEWQRGLLEYVRAADPSMSGVIDAILKNSQDYAPLARLIDPADATAAAAAARSNPLMRMHGSGRQIRDIFETTLENAARLVSHAHRKMVLESIVKLSKEEGMGFLVEKVPRDRVRTEVNFEKLRQQLEDAGVDTSAIDPDTILTYFDLADRPRGADPIVVVKEADGLNWYHLPQGVFEVLNGLDIPRLSPALDIMFGAPARTFRMGTTGLRASFSLFTNPTRDLRTFLMQTQSHANPAKLAASYFSELQAVLRAGLGGKRDPYVEAFYRLGAQLGQPLGIDIRHTRRAAKALGRERVARVVTNPIDHLRDLFQISESAPRVAELKLIAEEVGWRPGTPMTPNQAVQMGLAAKRATVDFSAGGRISKVMNQAIPFYGPTVQGMRSFARALRDNPARAVLTGLTVITVPALLNWWRNKDEEWYRNLPWRERYLYDNVADDEGNVWQIPRPPEWGNMFAVLPEALLDSWYTQDPQGAGEALKHILATSNPLDYPVPLKIAREQWQNRIEFFDRPIVPRSQIDLPPGEQRGPYTTKLAEWIGNAFPGHASPRRIDAAVRGYFGGAVPDLLDALGLGASKGTRDFEMSDIPVFGRAFRRGGQFSGSSLAMGDYYDDLARYTARGEAMEAAAREGRQPLSPLSPHEYAYWKLLEEMRPYFKVAARLADQTTDFRARQSLHRDMAREAARLIKQRPGE